MAARHQALGLLLLWDKDYQSTNQRRKKGGDGGETSSADDHIAGCLFSSLVADCKRAVCVANQIQQGLCYSVMLIILKLPRCSKQKKINIILMPVV